MNETSTNFNNTKYADHVALGAPSSFYSDNVYLYKIFRELTNTFPHAGAKVLELACADGSFCSFLKSKGFDPKGLDIAEQAIAKAQANGVNAQVCNFEDGFKEVDQSFDAVIACEIIEHLYDTDYFISEIKRVLKPGGYVFITTPNLASLKNRIKLLFGAYPQYSEYNLTPTSAGHIRNYTPRTLKKQLRDHGFEIITFTSPNFYFPMAKPFPLFIKKIAMFLGDLFPSLGSHIVIVAKQ